MINTNWLALYTKKNCEKSVLEKLTALGLRCYLPQITVIRQWSDRKKKLQVPAINGIVFVQVAIAEKNQVFQVSGPVGFVHLHGKLAEIPHHEIERMQDHLEGRGVIDQSQYRQGDTIYIEALGCDGVISKIGSNQLWAKVKDMGLTVCLKAA